MVRSNDPVALVALGDLGHAWSGKNWEELAGAVLVCANHDNMDALSSAHNMDGTPVLARDGEIRLIGGLKVGSINGIISKRPRRDLSRLESSLSK